jgi:hypothetical protein
MESQAAPNVPGAQASAELTNEPIQRSSTVRTSSTLHHNEFDDRFLSRYRQGSYTSLIRYEVTD